ncbi:MULTISPECIES: hypothetical protein [unclassified Rhizobium]|uniref:hypothetical protein n=1 Tax=unclassified Rhizobium TaxID=2613769 RepID=UPI00145693CE|nr:MULTISPECIES: hypothetical protein [unclassified Rhizobium]NLR83768.1 hypothetical protein [Rhizobium sp. P28RR-XV]
MMKLNLAVQDKSTSQERGDELRAIMRDAVKNVLERPETLRGPYVIRDADLKLKERR